jgi:hypothetical protein
MTPHPALAIASLLGDMLELDGLAITAERA